ncbi:hypothetical protein CU098_001120, partial [Rhizopus stolonifer]
MTNLPSIVKRKEHLVFKIMIRLETLPEDTLIMQLMADIVEADGNAKKQLLGLRQRNLDALRAQTNAPVLISTYRPFVGWIDPILLLMLIYDRQRILRWRLEWIP